MAVHKGIVQVPAAAPAGPPKVLVRLKGRAILEPGCITVEAGHVLEIPKAHFDPQHHDLVNPPAVADAPVAEPPAEAGTTQPSADSEGEVRLFE